MKMPGSRAVISQAPEPEVDSLTTRVNVSLRGFYVHARGCDHCKDPYAVYKSPTRQLCDIGHQLAQEIAMNLYNKARTTPRGKIEVTFPEGWESVDGLIRALTHKLQGEPTNCVDIGAHDAFRASSAAREAATTGKIHYVPASRSEEPLNRGSGYARDLSHRTGEPHHRHSSHRDHSRRHSRSEDPRNSSLNLIGDSHRSPSPSSSSGSHHHHRRAEDSSRQLSSSPRSNGSGPRVAFNPDVETRYF